MKLSDLKTGERGVIVKVMGHGGFRKRIVEMGFIKGKVVDVLQNAPLHDPVKYKLMGYEVSLRHSEADMIEVISVEEAERIEKENKQNKSNNPSDIYDEAANNASVEDKSAPNPTPLTEGQLRDAAMKKRRTINVALVGNPNCGKTSLFNFASGAHERVGNYSGVTVDAKVGHAEFEGYEFNIVDLPGTYSLSAYSPEELYVRKQIIENTPDVIINVIDTSNLERNLYLTTQLIDMHLRMVCALNMFDETEKRGDNVDYAKLGELFGVPMIPTTFTTGRGVELLFHIIINMYEGLDFLDANGNLDPEVAEGIKQWHEQYSKSEKEQPDHDEDFASGVKPKHNVFRHIHINHGTYIEEGITAIQAELKKETTYVTSSPHVILPSNCLSATPIPSSLSKALLPIPTVYWPFAIRQQPTCKPILTRIRKRLSWMPNTVSFTALFKKPATRQAIKRTPIRLLISSTTSSPTSMLASLYSFL